MGLRNVLGQIGGMYSARGRSRANAAKARHDRNRNNNNNNQSRGRNRSSASGNRNRGNGRANNRGSNSVSSRSRSNTNSGRGSFVNRDASTGMSERQSRSWQRQRQNRFSASGSSRSRSNTSTSRGGFQNRDSNTGMSERQSSTWQRQRQNQRQNNSINRLNQTKSAYQKYKETQEAKKNNARNSVQRDVIGETKAKLDNARDVIKSYDKAITEQVKKDRQTVEKTTGYKMTKEDTESLKDLYKNDDGLKKNITKDIAKGNDKIDKYYDKKLESDKADAVKHVSRDSFTDLKKNEETNRKKRSQTMGNLTKGSAQKVLGGYAASAGMVAQNNEVSRQGTSQEASAYLQHEIANRKAASGEILTREELEKAANRQAQESGRRSVELGASLINKGNEATEQATKGMSEQAKWLADLYQAGVGMAMDASVGALTGQVGGLGSMFVRSAGEQYVNDTQKLDELSLNGITPEQTRQALTNAFATGATEAGSELMFGVAKPFKAVYGAAVGDKLTNLLTSKIEQKLGGKLSGNLMAGGSTLVMSAVTEGLEEVAADIVEPAVANVVYNNLNPRMKEQLVQEATLSDMARDFSIGAAMGGIGGVVDSANQVSRLNETKVRYLDDNGNFDLIGVTSMLNDVMGSTDKATAKRAAAMKKTIEEGGILSARQLAEMESARDAVDAELNRIDTVAYDSAMNVVQSKGQRGFSFDDETVEKAYNTTTEKALGVLKGIDSDNKIASESEDIQVANAIAAVSVGSYSIEDVKKISSSERNIRAYEKVTGEALPMDTQGVRMSLIEQGAANLIKMSDVIAEEDVESQRAIELSQLTKNLGSEGQMVMAKAIKGIENNVNALRDTRMAVSSLYEIGTSKNPLPLSQAIDKASESFPLAPKDILVEAYMAGMNDKLTGESSGAKYRSKEGAKRSDKWASGVYVTEDLTPVNAKRYAQEAETLSALANVLGTKIEIVNEIVDKDGNVRQGTDGLYNPSTDTIVIAMSYTRGAVQFTLSHELTHTIKTHNVNAYNELRDFLYAKWNAKDSEGLAKAIERKKLQYSGQDLTDLELFEEIMADQMNEIFDENLMREFGIYKPEEARTILDALKDFIRKLKEVVGLIEKPGNVKLSTYEAQMRRQLYSQLDIYDEMQTRLVQALRDATDVNVAAEKAQEQLRESIDTRYEEAYWNDDDEAMAEIIAEEAARKGYTYKAYHHTENAFTEFDLNKARRNMDVQGFYFSEDPNAEAEYGSMRYDVFLRMNNPYIVDSKESADGIPVKFGVDDYGVKVRDWLKSNGYDSLIRKADYMGSEADEYIVLDANQIKSADEITFNDSEYEDGEMIPPSQRFDDSTNDIRYSKENTEYLQALADKDIEKADRIVGEYAKSKGYDKLAYHGTETEEPFYVFDRNMVDDNRSFFFSTKDVALTYGDEYYEVFLNLRNPLILDGNGANWRGIADNGSTVNTSVRIEDVDVDNWAAVLIIETESGDEILNSEMEIDEIRDYLAMNGMGEESIDEVIGTAYEAEYDPDGYTVNRIDFRMPQQNKEQLTLRLAENEYDESESYMPYTFTITNDDTGEVYHTGEYDNLAEVSGILDSYGMYGDALNYLLDDGELTLMHNTAKSTRAWAEIAEGRGHDGVIFKDIYDAGGINEGSGRGEVVIAFNPEQIKSANTVTYDDEGNIIPLDDRFNDLQDDIRYSQDSIPFFDGMERRWATVVDRLPEDFTRDGQYVKYLGTNEDGYQFYLDRRPVGAVWNKRHEYIAYKPNNNVTNIRWSQDSDGNSLTEDQIEFFKDSQARDDEGRLTKLYHGSTSAAKNGGFTEFFSNYFNFFTPIRKMANEYATVDGGIPVTYKDITKVSNASDLQKYLSDNDLLLKIIVDDMGDDIFYDLVEYEKAYPNGTDDTYVEIYDLGSGHFVYDDYMSTSAADIIDIVKSGDLNTVVVYPTYLNLKNPYIYNDPSPEGSHSSWDTLYVPEIDANNDELTTRDVCSWAKDNGYDGVIFKNIYDGYDWPTDVHVAFNSNQIKSVNNEHPTEDPDIRYSAEMDAEYLEAVANNDMTKAQQMVDEAAQRSGFNRKLYHGTQAGDFTVFDTKNLNNNMGSHFGSKEIAEGFANGDYGHGFYGYGKESGRIYSVWIKADNPFETFDWFGQDDGYPAMVAYDLAHEINTPEAMEVLDDIAAIHPYIEGWYNEADNGSRDFLQETYFDTEEQRERLYGNMRKLLDLGGYDSIRYENMLEVVGDIDYIIQHPEQIKSADPVTYDDNGNVIPLSQRFNPENEDIRYSVDPEIERIKNKKRKNKTDRATLRDAGEKLSEKDFYELYRVTHTIGYFADSQKAREDAKSIIENGFKGDGDAYGLNVSTLIRRGENTVETETSLRDRGWSDDDIDSLKNHTARIGTGYEFVDGKLYTNVDFGKRKYRIAPGDLVMIVPEHQRIDTKHTHIVKPGFKPFEYEIIEATNYYDDTLYDLYSEAYDKYQMKKRGNNISNSIESAGVDDVVDVIGNNGVVRYSYSTWTDDEKTRVTNALVDAGFDKDNVDKWIKDINSVSAIIGNDRSRLDFEAAPHHTMIKDDSEYYKTADASTLCAKRLPYQGTFNAIQHRMKDTFLTSDQLIDLRNMMVEHGYDSPCAVCYVESRRRHLGKYTNDFFEGYTSSTGVIVPPYMDDMKYMPTEDELLSKDSRKALKDNHPHVYRAFIGWMNANGIKTGDLNKPSKPKKAKIDELVPKWLSLYDEDRKFTPSFADLTTTDGLEKTRVNHPMTYYAFTGAMAAKGSGSPKVVELRTEYRGEIAKLTKKQINDINSIGGFRLQSYSDFETVHLLDMMQIVADLSARGMTSQAYTKVPEFAWVFGDTGVKINLSLIAEGTGLDENGNLIFSSIEGMDINDAMALRNAYSKNVGTIIVGANDKHILKCMADDRIDFIIPFHSSGWGENELRQMNMESYQDYEAYQNERSVETGKAIGNNIDPLSYWDFSKTGKENAETYLRKCKEQGRIPKFENFLVDNGDGSWSLQPDGSTDGYWKTLTDFKMYDNDGVGSEQLPVQPNFNMDKARGILETYEGGANSLPVAQDVVDAFIEKYGNERLSIDSYGDRISPKMAEYMKDSKLRDDEGRLIPMYHGTNTPGFTVFDPSHSDDGISLFFTDNPDVAESYIQGLIKTLDPYKYISESDFNELSGDELVEKFNSLQRDINDGAVQIVEITDELIDDATKEAEAMAKEFLPKAIRLNEMLTSAYEILDNKYNNEYNSVTSKLFNVISSLSNMIYGIQLLSVFPSDESLSVSTVFAPRSKTVIPHYEIRKYVGEEIDDSIADLVDELRDVAYEASTKSTRMLNKLKNYKHGYTVVENIHNQFSYTNAYRSATEAVKREMSISTNNPQSSLGNGYKVYLNLTNPLIIDGNGANWHSIPNKPIKTAMHIFTGLKTTIGSNVNVDSNRFNVSIYNADNKAKPFVDLKGVSYDEAIETMLNNNIPYSVAQESLTSLSPYNTSAKMDYALDEDGNEVVKKKTREWAEYAKDNDYDGVIFKNIHDIGGYSGGSVNDASTIAIAFDSNQVKSVLNENPTDDPDIRYSDPMDKVVKEDDVNDYINSHPEEFDEENYPLEEEFIAAHKVRTKSVEELQAQVEYLKNQKKLNAKGKGKQLDPKWAREQSHDIIKSMMMYEGYRGEQTRGGLAKEVENGLIELRKIYVEYIDNEDYDGVDIGDYAMDIAEFVVQNIRYIEDISYEDFITLRDYLKTTRIEVSDDIKSNIPDYGDFRKHQMGKVKLLNSDGQMVDEVYEELMSLLPHRFTEDITHPADQLMEICRQRDALSDYSAFLDGEDTQYLVKTLASDLVDIAATGKPLTTWADRKKEFYDKALAKQKVNAALAKKKALAKQKEIYKRREQEAKASKKNALNKLRDTYKRREVEQKQKRAEAKAKAKERKTKTVYSGHIKDNYKTLAKWILNPNDKQHVPEALKKPLAELLTHLDIESSTSKKFRQKYGTSTKTANNLRAVKDALVGVANDELGFVADEGLMDKIEVIATQLDGLPISDASVSDLKVIDDLLKYIVHQVRYANKMFGQQKYAPLAQLGKGTIMDAESIVSLRGKNKQERDGVLGILDRMINEGNVTPIDFFDLIGGDMNEVFTDIRKGMDKHIEHIDELRKWNKQFFSKFDNKKKPGSTTEGWRDIANAKEFRLESGDTVTLTPAQMMSLYCLMQREQAAGHILRSGIVVMDVSKHSILKNTKLKKHLPKNSKKLKAYEIEAQTKQITMADAVKIINDLKKIDGAIEAADNMYEFMATRCADWGNEASMELFGYRKFTEQNYFPIKTASNYLKSTGELNQGQNTIKNPGFSKSTVKGASNPIMLDDIFSVFAEHCNKMSQYNAFAVPIENFLKVYNFVDRDGKGNQTKSVKTALENAWGKSSISYIEKFLKDVQNNVDQRTDGLTEFVTHSLAAYKKASIGGNMRVALQQPTAIVRAFLYINPKYFIRLSNAHLIRNRKEMMEHCPIAMWKSWGHSQVDMARDIEEIIVNREWSKLDLFTMEIYSELDNVTWGAIWSMVKNETKAEHPELQEGSEEYWKHVSERAAFVFDRTQVVDSVFHRSEMMRNKDTMSKLFTSFMAEPTRTYNMCRTELVKAHWMHVRGEKGAAEKRAKVISVFIANAIAVSMAAALADALRDAISGDDDKENASFFQRWWTNTVSNFFQNVNPLTLVPGLNQIPNMWEGWSPEIMAFQGYQKLINNIKDLTNKVLNGDESNSWTEIAIGMAESLGYVTGVPVKNVEREFKIALSLVGIEPHAAEAGHNPDAEGAAKKLGIVGTVIEEGRKKIANLLGFKKSKSKSDDKKNADYETIYEGHSTLLNEALKKLGWGGKSDKELEEEALGQAYQEFHDATWNMNKKESEEYAWKHVMDGYTKVIENADWDELEKRRKLYKMCVGSDGLKKFDEKVQSKLKSAVRGTVGYYDDDIIKDRTKYINYLKNTYEWTDEQISSEIIAKTDRATDCRKAIKMADEDAMYDALADLVDAGLTYDDFEYMWNNNKWGADLKGYSTGNLEWPTLDGTITSNFGHRSSPGGIGSTYHQAIDIGVPMNTEIKAADGGTVIYAGWYGGYGYQVAIEHEDGTQTYYSHLNSYGVKKGQKVAQGDVIALSGSTGNSTGPHLDFKVRRNGEWVNPINYLPNR